ncbi:MAG: T9SS type A sorting domain-containing protein [Candidatus Cloacimonetes bacterium]|nr:T9SS type A sorting domain-containing protein [Candidatus Cloacimonadota bacterium]
MKHILLFVMICLITGVNALDYNEAIRQLERQDEIMEQLILTQTVGRGQYLPAYHEIYPVSIGLYHIYDGYGISHATIEEWDGTQWVHVGDMYISYESGQMVEIVVPMDETQMRCQFTWEDEHIVEASQQMYIQDEWENFCLETYTYEGDNLTFGMREIYISGFWVETQRATWTYSGTQVIEALMEINQVTHWENDMMVNVTWSRDNITQVYIEWWDSNAWQPDSRNAYTYNGDGNCLTDIEEEYMNGWELDYRDTFTYDGALMMHILAEDYDAGAWENHDQTFLTYSGTDLQEQLSQEWDDAQWVNEERWLFESSDIDDDAVIPRVGLDAWPNPFNPEVTVSFSLVLPGQAEMAVYDIRGRLVRTLHSGSTPAGEHNLTWNGTDTSGAPVASGVYLLRLTTPQGTQSRKLTLLK